MTTRLSFFRLIVVLLMIPTLARAQGTATYQATTAPDVEGSQSKNQSIQSRIHLALQLVKRPDLNKLQVQIILDDISKSTSDFFEASNATLARKIKADNSLQSFTQWPFAALPNNQTTELFSDIASGKTDEDILKQYYSMSALPLKERKTSFRNASANDKSYLWRTHLALFLVKRPELNEQQKEIILAGISLATPEYFRSTDSARKAKVRGALRSLEEQIEVAFSLDDAVKIFGTLYDYESLNDPGLYKNLTYSQSGWQNKDKEQVESYQKRSECTCSKQSDYCPIWSACGSGSCTPTQSGCGTLWSYRCDGLCR